MPTVILEAMFQGCPIIATDVGAVSEQVSVKNGILIEPGNINALYKAMKKAISTKDYSLQKMKDYSRQVIKERFVWDLGIKNMINKFLIITQSSIKKKKNISND